MEDMEQWLFLGFILGWIVLVSTGLPLGGLAHALPLIAVCILANRIRRCSVEAGPTRLAIPDEVTRDEAGEAQLAAR